ncbi:serine/threonine-protein kinase [Paludisphaera soli]|uniref:serine/threonine-protein kinase n=1 Tax=Paludisphaera soli TaxID=2712865 RepID=UPI0013EBDA72|nr:serine/threonine-protein kinase [Paludisphaera soli]
MPTPTHPCPDPRRLAAAASGEADEAEETWIFAHVDACPGCSARLAELESNPPTILAALRLAGPETPPVAPGETFPREEDVPGYEILEPLGSGAMGVVHKARHVRLGRLVALKRLRVHTPNGLHRFRREAETVAALQHPGIVQIFEVGDLRGYPFLAMEYVAGGTLFEFLRRGPRPAREAAAFVELLAGAVQHAHGRGVVHRDLKPSNILLRPADERASRIDSLHAATPKIGDFGIAKWISQEPLGEGRSDGEWATLADVALGTPPYMAPEQIERRDVGPPVDVYALGVILYEVTTGRTPFVGESPHDLLRRVLAEEPSPPSRIRPDVPRDLDVIVLKCLRKDASRRYASASELAADLRRFLDGRPILARPASLPEVAWKAARRRPAVAGALAVAQASLVVLAVGAWWYNGLLREALRSTRAAERQAEGNARVALEAHEQLIEQVRKALRDAPATRTLRRGLLETAVEGLRRVTTADATAPRLSRASAHQLLGEVHWELGRTGEAIAEMERSLAISEALLVADPGLDDARDQLLATCRRLGSFHLRADRPDAARAFFRRAVDRAETWREASPADPRAEIALIEGLGHLGHAAHWVGDPAAARPPLERMLALAESRLAAHPDDERAGVLLAQALDLLGGMDESAEDLVSARERYQRSLDLSLAAEARAGGAEADSALRDIMVGLNNLALIHLRLRDVPKALVAMDAGLDRARRWAERDPEDVQRKLDLIDALCNRASVSMGDLDFAAAIPFLEEAGGLLERLHAEGRLTGLPIYDLERRESATADLALCRRALVAVDDESVVWAAPEELAPRVAEARIALLQAAGQPAEAVATAERLLASPPEGAGGWMARARSCSLLVGGFEGDLAERLRDESVRSLARVYDLAENPPKRRELETDDRLAAARRSPAFAAILARAAGDVSDPTP